MELKVQALQVCFASKLASLPLVDILITAQDLIPTPLTFEFSRGYVQELRIHIPWTQLLSQPIEISLRTIECVLKARTKQDFQKDTRSKLGSK